MNTEKPKTIKFLEVCKEKTITTWKSGHKGKALCIAGALAVLMVLVHACGGGNASDKNKSRSSPASIEAGIVGERAKVGSTSGRGDESVGITRAVSNNAEEFPEEVRNNIQTGWDGQSGTEHIDVGGWKDFEDAFISADEDYNGVIYRLYANRDIKVLKASRNGYFVEHERFPGILVWVETQKRYDDGETFGRGFYVRFGQVVEKNVSRYGDTFPRYIEVTDEEVLEKLRAQVEEEEGKTVVVDVPVKSLCGFAIGATPSDIESLCKTLHSNGRSEYFGELATPFRHCHEVLLEFSAKPPLGGRHLCHVELIGNAPLETIQELREEVETIVAMLEKKFGIKLKKTEENTNPPFLAFYYIHYRWETEGGEDCIPQSIDVGVFGNEVKVDFESDLMSPREWNDWRESQRAPKLSADAGADQL